MVEMFYCIIYNYVISNFYFKTVIIRFHIKASLDTSLITEWALWINRVYYITSQDLDKSYNRRTNSYKGRLSVS